MKITEQEYLDGLEIQCNRLKNERAKLKTERDEAIANYRSLEIQYTDLNRLWEKQNRDLAALRAALLHLADSARSADRLIDYTFKNARDVHAGLDHAIEAARRTLAQGE